MPAHIDRQTPTADASTLHAPLTPHIHDAVESEMRPNSRMPSGKQQPSNTDTGAANASTTTAHRTAYILVYGDPGGVMHIDHLCKNPRCVRPSHLEAVTPQENHRRRPRVGRTHCPHVHLLDPENT